MPKTPYDVSASWDDPFERREERRANPRTSTHFVAKIAVNLAHKPTPLVGPAVVDDISATGLRCRTKHRLSKGQSIRLYISTKGLPAELGLPKGFIGQCQVVRSEAQAESVSEVALRFDEELRDDINLAIFVDHLHSLARAASS